MKFDGFQVSCFETMHRVAPDKSSGLTASVQSEDGKGAHVGLCVGLVAAQFELVDETGSLPVEILGSCLAAAAELPRDGDRIELTVEILVFAHESQPEECGCGLSGDESQFF